MNPLTPFLAGVSVALGVVSLACFIALVAVLALSPALEPESPAVIHPERDERRAKP